MKGAFEKDGSSVAYRHGLQPGTKAALRPFEAIVTCSPPGKNRQVTVFGAIEVGTGCWVYGVGRRCAADFIPPPAPGARRVPPGPP